jgi:hypothetical protein
MFPQLNAVINYYPCLMIADAFLLWVYCIMGALALADLGSLQRGGT